VWRLWSTNCYIRVTLLYFYFTPCHTTTTMAFHGRVHALHMEYPWSTWNPIAFYGNTMVLYGHCMTQWYSREVFMGWHVQFHGVYGSPWNSMSYYGHYGIPWKNSWVYIWNFHEVHGISWYSWEYDGSPWWYYGLMVSDGNFHWFTCGIFMECMESHGTRCHTTGTMAFHGGISMKHMESHGILYEYHISPWWYYGPHGIPRKFSWVYMWNFHGVHEITWYFMEIPWSPSYPMEVFMCFNMEFSWVIWNPMEFYSNTTLGFHRNPKGDFRTGSAEWYFVCGLHWLTIATISAALMHNE